MAPGPYQPEGPLNLLAQTSLGEDHFLLAAGLLDPVNDMVVAYRSTTQTTEAMVVQNGVLHQLTRNGSGGTTGWSLTPVVVGEDAVVGVSEVVAGTTQVSGTVGALHVVYRANGEVTMLVASGNAADPWSAATVSTLGWPGGGALHLNQSAQGGLLVYSFTPVQGDHTFSMFWSHVTFNGAGDAVASGTVSFDNGTDATDIRWTLDPSTGRVHMPALGQMLIFFASAERFSSSLTGGEATPSGDANETGQRLTAGNFTAISVPSKTGSEQGNLLTVNDVRKMDDWGSPIVVVTLTNGQVWCISNSTYQPPGNIHWMYNDRNWLWRWLWQPPWDQPEIRVSIGTRPLPKTEDQYTPWANANKMLDLFVTQRRNDGAKGHVVSVVRQYPWGNWQDDSAKPQFYSAQPLHAGVAVVSVPVMTTQTQTLITIADDGTLLVLEQDPATTLWSETTVHLPSQESLQISCHRVQLSITDARGTPVPRAQVSVTAAATVSAIVSASNSTAKPPTPATVRLGSDPVALISDAKGQITIAVPATGLSAPDLTFAVAASGLSASTKVGPAGAVNAYLAGGPQLGPLPKLTATVLTQATTNLGQLVPTKSPSDLSAADAVGYFNGAAQAGINASKKDQGPKGVAKPRPFVTDATPKRLPQQARAGYESGLGDFFGDLLQAIKSGATQVTSVAVSTAEGWALTISTTVGSWSSQALTMVVDGLEAAGHAFHALINAIGAEIMDFVHWLEAKILGVLIDTVALAANFDVWMADWTSWMTTQLGKGERTANTWFSEKIKNVDDTFDSLIKDKRLTAVTVGDPQPEAIKKSAPSVPVAAQAPSTAPPDPHHSWLHDKMIDHQVTPTSQPAPLTGTVAAQFTTLIGNLKTNLEASLDSFGKAGSALFTAVKKILDNPSDMLSMGVPALLTVIKDFVDGILQLGKTVVDFALDLAALLLQVIADFLNTPLPDVPIISTLLRQANFQGTLTVGKVATLMMAFPAVVAYKALHLDLNAAPFKGTVVNGRPVVKAKADGPHGVVHLTPLQDRAFVASAVTAVWALVDASALMEAANEPPVIESDYTPPGLDFFGGVDLVAPCMINALTYPSEDGIPFSGELNWEKAIGNVGWLCGFGFPIITALGYHWKHQPGVNGVQAAIIDRILLAFTSLLGVSATFFSLDQVLIDASTDFDPIALVLALTGYLGAALAFLSDSSLNKSTEGISAAVAAIVTIASGATSATLIPLDVPAT